MLFITMNKSAASAKKYYCEQYHKEGQSETLDYYSEDNILIGKWGGKAAAQLGLSGDIQRRDFARLCDNRNIYTGCTLTSRNDKDRTVGYDFTFNASKSVSLAYALGKDADKKIILDAFQASVAETMAEVETGMQTRVRVEGKNENRMTGNIVYGAFTHFTARPILGVSDPNLHQHCFVFNATFDELERKFKAGQFRQINQDAPYYEAVFQATFAHKLQQAGYAVERTKHGFELSGLEKETLDKFSRRTQEIEDYAQEHGITNEEQKSKIGLKTREAKHTALSPEAQETEWFSRLSTDELTAILSLKGDNNKVREDAEREVDAAKVLAFSLAHHLERKSVVSDKELLATAIKSAIGKAKPSDVRKAFESDTNILTATEQLRHFVTTKEALAEEKRLIQYCTESRNRFRPINEQYEPQNPLLNEQQKAAVRHALSSTDGISLITGKAGTGKTTLMQEVKQGILASGKNIFSFAPTSEASRGVQRSEGFEDADTVASLILNHDTHPNLKHQVIWIDEAGLLSNRDMNGVLAIAKAQSARVILSGDTRQHSSVERGDALRILQQEAGLVSVKVDKIQRQRNAEYKEAVHYLSQGNTEHGFAKLDQIGAIHEMADASERVNAIAEEYVQSAYGHSAPHAAHSKTGDGLLPSKEVLVIAPTHAEGDVVTQQIRERLKQEHIIGQEERSFKVLKNRNLTEAEKQQSEHYTQGDVLVFHQHSKGIRGGQRLEVLNAEESSVFAKDAAGLDYTVPLSESKKFSVFEQREIPLSVGDKVRISANGKSNEGTRLFNGSTYHIAGFDEQGNMQLSNGASLPPDFGHLTTGYVATSHGSQGKTADKVILSQSSASFGAASMEQFYVSASRGKEAVSIYTDDKEQLKEAVGHSAQRTSATELMAKREEQAQEIARVANFQKEREQERERNTATYHYLTAQNRHDGLQATARTD